jgi:hypothetical protein
MGAEWFIDHPVRSKVLPSLGTDIPVMPPPIHLILPDQMHHVVQRGNNRQAVFFSEDDHQFS